MEVTAAPPLRFLVSILNSRIVLPYQTSVSVSNTGLYLVKVYKFKPLPEMHFCIEIYLRLVKRISIYCQYIVDM
jgi:hypothetical protein